MHSNRVVIHPDYVGFGLGIKFINVASSIMKNDGYRVMIKFSSIPILKSMIKDKNWKFKNKTNDTSMSGRAVRRKTGFRKKVTTYSFEYVGG